MLTIVFYFNKGAQAKLRARSIVAHKGNETRIYDVTIWDGRSDVCDAIEIMPDVPKWHCRRIEQTYGPLIEKQEKKIEEAENEEQVQDEQPAESDVKKEARHRGGGRWFIYQGDKVISGPHDKDTAKGLVS